MLMSRQSGLGLTWSMMNIFSISHGKRRKDERTGGNEECKGSEGT